MWCYDDGVVVVEGVVFVVVEGCGAAVVVEGDGAAVVVEGGDVLLLLKEVVQGEFWLLLFL